MANKRLTDISVKALKPRADRYEVPDGDSNLKIVVYPSGSLTWIMRFRRPGGKLGSFRPGPFDPTATKKSEIKPEFGKPMTLAEVRSFAADINLERKSGVDVISKYVTKKNKLKTIGPAADVVADAIPLFPARVKQFIEGHFAKKTIPPRRPRRWRETARMLGLSYPLDGGEPEIIKGGLCDRWRDKDAATVTEDEVLDLIIDAKSKGIPGLGRKAKGQSSARARKMGDAFGTLFKWLKKERHIKINPCADIEREAPPPGRDRVLNCQWDVRRADELRWFWAACETIGGSFGAIAKLLLLTGCRLNEIARAHSDEFNDDLSMFSMDSDRTKNKRAFTVALPPLARKIIGDVLKLRLGNYYVFTTNGRSPISGFSKYKKRLEAAMLAEAIKERGEGTQIKHWVLHNLRHTMATGLGNLSVRDDVVEAALNHVKGQYNHAKQLVERKAALEVWAEHIEAIVSGQKGKK